MQIPDGGCSLQHIGVEIHSTERCPAVLIVRTEPDSRRASFYDYYGTSNSLRIDQRSERDLVNVTRITGSHPQEPVGAGHRWPTG